MSTLSSPRPSANSSRAQSPASSLRRPSFDNLNSHISSLGTVSSAPAHRALSPALHTRRNRAALRDYYNLKSFNAAATSSTHLRGSSRRTHADDTPSTSVIAAGTELDSPGFDPQRYADHLLTTSSLSTILKAENTLVGDIRTLDGERKALVYDNYSKLIRAVDTIGRMRKSMADRDAPLIMAQTLEPAIAYVAETAEQLIREGEERRMKVADTANEHAARDLRAEKDTVRWVLAAPSRLEWLLREAKTEEARIEWDAIRSLLEKWEGVRGVAEVREACEKVMTEKPSEPS